jgi:Ca-activated chloride channel homolog
MRKFLVLQVCLACGLLASRAAAQDAVPVFKSSVAMVPISATVRDGRGRTVTTLKASDFEVRDNGQPRPIVTFEIDQTTPLTVAVLVDTSGSMRLESKLASAREVVREIGSGLRDGIDSVGLFTFDAAVHELQPFTDRPSAVAPVLAAAAPFGVTSLYDAIAETARRLDAQPSVRRAIVVLTDGIDTSSALAPADVSARASAIDAPVYIVATVPKIDQASYVQRSASANARLTANAQDLARWTGGDLLWASPGGAVSAAQQILAELRHQYLIAVDSVSDGEWRRLEVKVRNPRLNVRARSGYVGRDNSSEY